MNCMHHKNDETNTSKITTSLTLLQKPIDTPPSYTNFAVFNNVGSDGKSNCSCSWFFLWDPMWNFDVGGDHCLPLVDSSVIEIMPKSAIIALCEQRLQKTCHISFTPKHNTAVKATKIFDKYFTTHFSKHRHTWCIEIPKMPNER